MEHDAALEIHKLMNPVMLIKPNNNHFGFEPKCSNTLSDTLSCKPDISIAFAITSPPKNNNIMSYNFKCLNLNKKGFKLKKNKLESIL
jgi:hypothetical protein